MLRRWYTLLAVASTAILMLTSGLAVQTFTVNATITAYGLPVLGATGSYGAPLLAARVLCRGYADYINDTYYVVSVVNCTSSSLAETVLLSSGNASRLIGYAAARLLAGDASALDNVMLSLLAAYEEGGVASVEQVVGSLPSPTAVGYAASPKLVEVNVTGGVAGVYSAIAKAVGLEPIVEVNGSLLLPGISPVAPPRGVPIVAPLSGTGGGRVEVAGAVGGVAVGRGVVVAYYSGYGLPLGFMLSRNVTLCATLGGSELGCLNYLVTMTVNASPAVQPTTQQPQQPTTTTIIYYNATSQVTVSRASLLLVGSLLVTSLGVAAYALLGGRERLPLLILAAALLASALLVAYIAGAW